MSPLPFPVIRAVGDYKHEGLFVNTKATPDSIRRHISPVFVRLRQQTEVPRLLRRRQFSWILYLRLSALRLRTKRGR